MNTHDAREDLLQPLCSTLGLRLPTVETVLEFE